MAEGFAPAPASHSPRAAHGRNCLLELRDDRPEVPAGASLTSTHSVVRRQILERERGS
jgi:hypothetical protein